MRASGGIDGATISELEKVLFEHSILYPRMDIEDFVKLVYQNEFGGGHMVLDEASSLARLTEEWNEPSYAEILGPLTEDIGNGIIRLNLRPAKRSGFSPMTVNRIFVLSANSIKGSTEYFKAKLDTLTRFCKSMALSFGPKELEVYLAGYEKSGYPPTSHSIAYREAYSPSYRVIRREYGEALDLLLKTDREFATDAQLHAITATELGNRPVYDVKELLKGIYGSDRVSVGPTGSIEISSGRTGIH